MKNIVIAIDPDQKESGFGIIYKEKGLIRAGKMKFAELVDYIVRMNDEADELKVFVEGGWLNQKSNWHSNKNANIASKIGKCVGANHQTGRLLIECLKFKGVDVFTVAPLKKTWAGADGKITQKELNMLVSAEEYEIIGNGRMNQDARDAVLLALFHGMII